MAFDSIDPFGSGRGDLQASIVASAVANGPMQKKDKSPFSPIDFMPYIERPKPDRVQEFKASLAHLIKKPEE